MKRETGLEHLTMLDISPPKFVSLAAGAGFDAVGLRIAPVTWGEQPWPVKPRRPCWPRQCNGARIRASRSWRPRR